ncbi:MAG: hypothetical protein SNJ54_13670 [Anaerolineae bacterium]
MLLTMANGQLALTLLPELGGCIASLQAYAGGQWVDVLRPTPPHTTNPSHTSSFLMLPWANRIAEGRFTFEGHTYQLQTTRDDGTARHGDVRARPWHVLQSDAYVQSLVFESRQHEGVNWPFDFAAQQIFTLHDNQIRVMTAIFNRGTSPMPAGFGHHPYFVRPSDPAGLSVTIPAAAYFPLNEAFLPLGNVQPVPPMLDFRTSRPVEGDGYNHLLTQIDHRQPIVLAYHALGLRVRIELEPAYKHVLIFTPAGEPSVAVEPMTMATNAHNLRLDPDITGLWTIPPNGHRTATFTLTVEPLTP